jgi:alkylation response protein AidB-like acyl-CoA dehydrogenase/SAM-dependent methyltransferase
MEELLEEAAQIGGDGSIPTGRAVQQLLRDARELADELAARPNPGLTTGAEADLERFAKIGLLTAPLPKAFGGLELGIQRGTHTALLRLLAIVGGADLALGRLFEGHVNGILLVNRYGTAGQMEQLAEDVCCGEVSGVWNTGGATPMGLKKLGQGFRLEGIKTFATGSAFVKRPIVTAELLDGVEPMGWQMTLPRMELLSPSLDRSFWQPLGMERSESFQIDFTDCLIAGDDLIGGPGDFYRDPMFYGGTIRFAAVQAGGILRLHAMLAAWLDERGRGEDPYQAARLGEVAIAAQAAVLWIERAGAVADECFYSEEKCRIERMHECADMTRTAILQLATRVIQLVTEGVGAHGLLQPFHFERVLRDLIMYLRQPAPDQVVATIGRFSREKLHRKSSGTEWGFWSDDPIAESLPPGYFSRIYQRKADPWAFSSSDYEREKYDITLASLPRSQYDGGLEIGCSIGVLTARLAERTKTLLGVDVTERALEQARKRCAQFPWVSFEELQVPQQMPSGRFDLIVVSEVAYYWKRPDLELAADGIAACQVPGGHLVLVHLTEPVRDYPQTGDAVHNYWTTERPEWVTIHSERHERFRLDVLERL